jgi:two-component system chemotaxis sensor kinase CheA
VSSWDEESLTILAEFLEDAEREFDVADEQLLAAEDSLSKEAVDALFRTFHSLKGVAACLNLEQWAGLSHDAENILRRMRDGTLEDIGTACNELLSASDALRRQLAVIRSAAEEGRDIAFDAEIESLRARLRRYNEDEDEDGTLSPPVETDAAAPTESNRIVPVVEPAKPQGRREEGPRDTVQRGGSLPVQKFLRVDVAKVDKLVNIVGELATIESMLANAPELRALGRSPVLDHLRRLNRMTRSLQRLAPSLRMLPMRSLFRAAQRAVRSASQKTGKKAQLVVEGEDTLVDRALLEVLEDPIVHLVRNAVDHGLELPDERLTAGKAETGTVRLCAAHVGDGLVVEVNDDGRGLDTDAILARAVAAGLASPDESPCEEEIFRWIFHPGFSTVSTATEISGRGVGLDVARQAVHDLRGRVSVDSKRGRRTRFRLLLPMNLSTIDGVLVRCDDQVFGIPTLDVMRVLEPNAEVQNSLGDKSALLFGGTMVPLVRLARALGLREQDTDDDHSIVVVESTAGRIAIIVDEVVARQPLVLKRLSDRVVRHPAIAGATILPDGRVCGVLRTDALTPVGGRTEARINREVQM